MLASDSGGGPVSELMAICGSGEAKQSRIHQKQQRHRQPLIDQLFSTDSEFDIDDILSVGPSSVRQQSIGDNRNISQSNSSRFTRLFDRLETNVIPESSSATAASPAPAPSSRPTALLRNRCASLPTKPSPSFFASLDRGKSLAPTSIIAEDGTVQPLFAEDGWPNFKAHGLLQSRQHRFQEQIAKEDSIQAQSPVKNSKSTFAAVDRNLRPRGGSFGSSCGIAQRPNHESTLLHRYAVHRAGSPLNNSSSVSTAINATSLKQLSTSVGSAEQFYHRCAYPTPRPSPTPFTAPLTNVAIIGIKNSSFTGKTINSTTAFGGGGFETSASVKYGFTVNNESLVTTKQSSTSLPCTPMKVTLNNNNNL